MAGPSPTPISSQSGDRAGWLIAREDGVIVAADERAMVLVGAGTIATLVGRAWPSLVTAEDAPLLAMAVSAFEHGEAWSGALTFQFEDAPVSLAVSLVPRAPGRGDVAVIHLAPALDQDVAPGPPVGSASSAQLDLEVLVDAIEASAELRDPTSIARAVLQSTRPAIPFEWGLVVRLFHQDHFGTPPAAEVVATYPTGLAGIDTGAAWTPIDADELALLQSGEPALDGRLARSEEHQSPLRRLPAFGMHSRLLVPLFAPAGAGVNGAVALYSTRPVAFTAADGLRLERFVRRLGSFVGPAVEPLPPEEPIAAPDTPSVAPGLADPGVAASELNTNEPPTDGEDFGELADYAAGALSEFAAGVAHELNNPLAAVLGYAQLLPQLAEEERAAALEAIEAETLRASGVTRDLLAFARQQPASRRDVHLETVVSRVLDVLRYELGQAGIEVVDQTVAVPPLQADEPQLEEAILHLLRNALEAMPDGGTLTVSTSVAGGNAILEVTDTGAGVSADIADRIFEPFVGGRAGTDHRGMGLAIVHGVAGAHGGRVWFESAQPRGSRFFLQLPLEDAAPTPG